MRTGVARVTWPGATRVDVPALRAAIELLSTLAREAPRGGAFR